MYLCHVGHVTIGPNIYCHTTLTHRSFGVVSGQHFRSAAPTSYENDASAISVLTTLEDKNAETQENLLLASSPNVMEISEPMLNHIV